MAYFSWIWGYELENPPRGNRAKCRVAASAQLGFLLSRPSPLIHGTSNRHIRYKPILLISFQFPEGRVCLLFPESTTFEKNVVIS